MPLDSSSRRLASAVASDRGVEGLTDELAAHAAVNPERALAARHVGGVAGGGVPPVDRQFILIAPAGHLLKSSRLDGIFVRYFRSC